MNSAKLKTKIMFNNGNQTPAYGNEKTVIMNYSKKITITLTKSEISKIIKEHLKIDESADYNFKCKIKEVAYDNGDYRDPPQITRTADLESLIIIIDESKK